VRAAKETLESKGPRRPGVARAKPHVPVYTGPRLLKSEEHHSQVALEIR